MRVNIKSFSFLTYLFVITNVSCQTNILLPGSQEFFIAEIVRVKRQAGYVYNKPNIPFDLPTQVPIVSTQAPNVDRTQAQHMFYAYPAPAPGGTTNTGYTTSTPTTTTTNFSRGSGYNYGSDTVTTGGTEALGLGQNVIAAPVQGVTDSSGYGYNSQTNVNTGGQSTSLGVGKTEMSSGSTATSSVSSTYHYDVPSSGSTVEDKSENSGSPTTNTQQGNFQSTSILSSGYDYKGPGPILTNTGQNSGTIQTEINSGTSQSSGKSSPGYSTSISEYFGTNTVTDTRLSQTATSSVNSNYRYDTPASPNIRQTSTISGSSQPAGSITKGYDHTDPIHPISNTGQTTIDTTEITLNMGNRQGDRYSDISGYNINAPSIFSNTAQISRSSSIPQTSSSSSTATSSVTTNYRYEAPKQTESNQGASFDVAINAPKYLTPNIIGNVEVNNKGNSGGISVSSGSASGLPSNSYVPPIVSDISGGPASSKPSETYIPSTDKIPTGSAVSCVGLECAGPSISRPDSLYTSVSGPSSPSTVQSSYSSSSSSYSSSGGKQSTPSITQPSNSYIAPHISEPSGFISAQPSTSYIPTLNTGSTQLTVTKPGKSYLLPQESPGPAQPRPPINQLSQSYIPPSNTGVYNQPLSSSPTNSYRLAAEPTPNPNYLLPNTIEETSSTASNANTAILTRNNNYLPPKHSSVQQESISVPAATYLPPVF